MVTAGLSRTGQDGERGLCGVDDGGCGEVVRRVVDNTVGGGGGGCGGDGGIYIIGSLFSSIYLAVCCLLFVVCCLLFVVCCLLFVVCVLRVCC